MAKLALLLCDGVGGAMLGLMGVLASLPATEVPVRAHAHVFSVATVLIATVLLLWWPQVSRRKVLSAIAALCLSVALHFTRWRFFAPPRICVLDIGQGDAILIQDGAAAFLVDTGPDDSVVAALARENVMHLDAILLTHLHADHTAGEESLRHALPCGKTLVARGVEREGAVEVGLGDVLCVGRFRLRVVSPAGVVDGDENDESLVLDVSFEDGPTSLKALLTGDAERDVLEQIEARGDLVDIDMLKAGHHGSEASLSVEQARMLKPEVAVASAGKNNQYGHPRPECVETLEEAGALFLCTAEVGDVEIRPGAGGPEVIYGRAGT